MFTYTLLFSSHVKTGCHDEESTRNCLHDLPQDLHEYIADYLIEVNMTDYFYCMYTCRRMYGRFGAYIRLKMKVNKAVLLRLSVPVSAGPFPRTMSFMIQQRMMSYRAGEWVMDLTLTQRSRWTRYFIGSYDNESGGMVGDVFLSLLGIAPNGRALLCKGQCAPGYSEYGTYNHCL